MLQQLVNYQFPNHFHRCSCSGAVAGTHMGSPFYLEAVLHHTTSLGVSIRSFSWPRVYDDIIFVAIKMMSSCTLLWTMHTSYDCMSSMLHMQELLNNRKASNSWVQAHSEESNSTFDSSPFQWTCIHWSPRSNGNCMHGDVYVQLTSHIETCMTYLVFMHDTGNYCGWSFNNESMKSFYMKYSRN